MATPTHPSPPSDEPRLVLKICRDRDWRAACADGHYRGSADDDRDGFIHLSTPEQVAGTLARHFAGQDDLVLVAFAASGLTALRWEPSRGGALSPHHYAPLPTALALWTRPVARAADGRHFLPENA
jgi:uncharacterized protein (DUF952 family)